MAQQPLLVTPHERDMLRGLLQALQQVRGGGDIDVQLVPGRSLTIATKAGRGRSSSDGVSGSSDNPKDLRVAPGSLTADAAEWDRAAPGVDESEETYTGTLIYMPTRTEWDDVNGELVEFVREMLFDSAGMLVSIGPEVKHVLNTAENCS